MHKDTCKYKPSVVPVGHPKIPELSCFLLCYITDTIVYTSCGFLKNETSLNSDDLCQGTITITDVIQAEITLI